MCANWLIDWLLKVQQAIFQSYSGCEKFINKKSERGDSGMGQHGQRLNTGICFSVSSDDKLVLYLFPGIPTGDPAIVAFYDKRIYKKVTIEVIVPKWPIISRKEAALAPPFINTMYVTTWPISKRGNKWEMLSYEAWTDGRTAVYHNKPVFWWAYKNEWPIC